MKNFLSLFVYRILFLCLLPVVILLLLLRSKSNVEYRYRLLERLGFISKKFNKGGIIVHAASVGEVIALKPFIEKLLIAEPNTPLTITTFTPTGSEQVKKMFAERVQHCYLPLDFFLSNALFLSRLAPKAIVFMETELWPSIIHQAKSRHCKLLLINGRLSKNSIKQYRKLNWLITPVLACFEHILCQSKQSYQGFIEIGASVNNCSLSGNLKYDLELSSDFTSKQQTLAQYLPTERPIWVMASTHAGDEQLAISAFKKLVLTHSDVLLVIVPRHPERFEQVAKLCSTENLSVVKRSENKAVEQSTQVWLLDSLGELMAMYSLASIVTMGGSFSDVGGHNPLEPALFKKPIIVGPRMDNFIEISAQLRQSVGLVTLEKSNIIEQHLAEQVIKLLENIEQAQVLGEGAFQVVQANKGASDLSVKYLSQLLSSG